MTPILEMVARWGSSKDPSQTFKEYLLHEKKIPIQTIEKVFNNLGDKTRVDLTSYETLDVPFMCKLLPHLCNGIDSSGRGPAVNDSNCLEYHLRDIKNMWNNIMHDAAPDKNLVDKVEATALKLLDIAGAKYSKGTDEINEAKDKVFDLISTIKKTDMTEEGKIHFYQQRLCDEGLPKLRERIQKYGSISPYFQHVNRFFSLQLTFKEKGAEKTISCKEILAHAKEKGTRVLIIEGQSGMGKSILMKELQADILGETRKIFKGSDEFDIPLLFECGNLTCETIADFASEEFPCLGETSLEEGLTEKALTRMKSLILVDGLDEANKVSQKMLDNIIAFLKKNKDLFCIFTSRPVAVGIFQEKLKKEGFSDFPTLALKQLTSKKEQSEFLRTACEKGKDISSAYKRTGLKLLSPVLLAIYSYLWLKEPKSLMYCKNEEHIMKAFVECGLKVARQRLIQRDVAEDVAEDVAKNILDSISLFSFCCLLKNQLEIKAYEIEWLEEEIEREFSGISVNMAPHEILSCFFVGSSNSKKDEVQIFLFINKIHQETLSSLYVAKQMNEKGKTFREIISEALEYFHPSQLPMPSASRFDFRTFFKE